VILRPFRETDRPAIHRITVACFEQASVHAIAQRKYGPFRGTAWQERKLSDIDADLEHHPDGAFVAAEDEQVVGFITTRADERTGIGHILNVAVDPARQGKGLGAALIRRALDYFAEQGMTHAKIETLVGNAAGEHLYPKLGFEELTRQIHYMLELRPTRR
jgi:ribosomal protein S18 acetylase RimI-like enzyme